jgi:uncharacterized protein YbaA (DUF1428 family)
VTCVEGFCDPVAAEADELALFGWVEWPDKAANEAMDGRTEGPMRSDNRLDPAKNPMPFDGRRMTYGGFIPVVDLFHACVGD